ncbi:MAG: alpha/beta hydrolase [Chloroflexi bacterium]|nr:MAG: alpha/beta hydrolase [Chloroflexota bacterium]
MSTKFLHVSNGTLAFDDSGGSGPLVVMVPGMGDVRAEYRFLAPKLAAAGYRVVTMDLRGHGESSADWPDYSIEAVGRDMLALVDHLNAGPATLVTTSYPTGAAVCAAAERPDAIRALVLIGAFVRDPEMSALQKLMLGLLLKGPWRVRAWDMYYNSLYPSQKPADLGGYRRELRANLSEPGRFEALKAMSGEPRIESERRLGQVQASALVVMGSKDPDFPSPEAEAQFIAQQLAGQILMVDGAGHYPHAEMPDVVIPAMLKFLAEVTQRNGTTTRTN